ncbi:MAG: (2Fe-2S) ferredoxin domain-containing protein [Rhodospirillaceae bacterium]|nr:(2Fe-2S) ferredoxin domain-containing protein [Rhodospirillaceae bacterium]
MFEVDYIPSEKPLFNIRLCTNKRLNKDAQPSCAGRGSRELADKIEKILLEQSIPAKLIRSPCMNNCKIGPNLKIQAGELYNGVTGDRLDEIIDAIKAEVTRRKAETDTTS